MIRLTLNRADLTLWVKPSAITSMVQLDHASIVYVGTQEHTVIETTEQIIEIIILYGEGIQPEQWFNIEQRVNERLTRLRHTPSPPPSGPSGSV
jgi:hypothetical protein